jgi:hypothetical protein
MDNKTGWAIAIGIVVGIALSIFAIFYRNTEPIKVVERHWFWDSSYTWSQMQLEPVPVMKCDGKTCTTTIILMLRSHTYIRCQATTTGTKLPPVKPELCQPMPGDTLRDRIIYQLDYYNTDKNKYDTAYFNLNDWNHLQIGHYFKITKNIANMITEIKP